MRFGDLPFWTLELSDQIHEVACFGDKEASIGNLDNEACVLPPQLLFRDPFFDQLIVNVYQPGEVRLGQIEFLNSYEKKLCWLQFLIRAGHYLHVHLAK